LIAVDDPEDEGLGAREEQEPEITVAGEAQAARYEAGGEGGDQPPRAGR